MPQTKDVQQLLEYFNLKQGNYLAIQQAFYHSSYINESKTTMLSNERLEFLGDSVLNLIIAQYLYEKYPDVPEGELTKRRAQLVREEALVMYSAELQLADYLLLGKGEEKSGGRMRAAIIADAFEAFIGAIFVTEGFDKARAVLLQIVEPIFNEGRLVLEKITDYKSEFQELIQVDPGKKIIYTVVSEDGPPHNRIYEVNVFVDEIMYGVGFGKTKKDAEQQAAEAALQKMVKNT